MAAAARDGPPLSGLRVLELGRSVGTAFCGKLLAEMGLEVTMIEPREGHRLRRAPPLVPGPSGSATSTLFSYLGAGKQSVVIEDERREAELPGLIAAADLVIHDLPDEAAAAQHLDFPRLRGLQPRIVVAAITPYGSTGPYASLPASDLTVHALSGQLYLTGSEDREPLLPYGHQPALFGGLVGAEVALAALCRTQQDGVARFVEVSQQEALASALDTALNRYSYAGKLRARYGNRLPDKMPLTDIYRTRDGYFLLCVYTHAQWRGFCTMLGRADWQDAPEMQTLAGRRRHGAEIEAALTHWFAARTSRQALEECQAHRLPSCIAASMGELLADPQLQARDHFAEVAGAAEVPLRYPKLPYVLSAGRSREERPPQLGEHRLASREARRAAQAHAPGNTAMLPLAGVRVLDITHAWAGPFAGLQLGFLGADIIKVEGARRPDGTRYSSIDARKLTPAYETGGYFHEWNRNKRAVAINMETEAGRALLRDLLRRCDVLLNNFSARVLPKWGFDWPAVHALNPRLVLVTMPAFGSQGPYRDFVGYGETIEGAGGLARLSGYEAGKPIRCGTAYPDPLAGHYGALAVIMGLAHRQQTGSGLWVDLSHQECVLHLIGEAVLRYQLTGETEEPHGNARDGLLLNEVVRCAGEDEWLAISVETEEQGRALAEAIGAGEPAAPDDLRRWAAARGKHEAMQALTRRGIPAAAVLKIEELFRDPHLAARGFFERVAHPVVGEKLHPRPGFRIAGAAVATRSSAPLFDGNTEEVLREILGLGDVEIAGLRSGGAIGGTPAGSPLPS